MGPVKNPPSPESDLKKDHSSSLTEEMAPAAKTRRLFNCYLENQKSEIRIHPSLIDIQPFTDDIVDDKKTEETNRATLDIPYMTVNNENAVTAVRKHTNVNMVTNSVSLKSTDEIMKSNSDDDKLTDLNDFESTNGDAENGTTDCGSDDHKSIENHNSNTSSAPEEMNSPIEVKEKMLTLADWTKDQINSTFELSNSVRDTLSEMITDGNRLCQETTRQFSSTYFSQTSSIVDKMVDQQSSQGGQPFSQSSALRRCTTSLERDHKFFDNYLKPHLKALKTELEVDTESTDESSDDEMAFPSSSSNMVSGNESSSLPQSPASTISDFSTFSNNADHSQLPWQTQSILEKTFPAERNYLRRRADIHSMWVWLSVKFKDRKRQLKKLNQILMNLPRPGFINNSSARRREQLTRSSSPESTCTTTILTGPPTPVSMPEASTVDTEGQNSTTTVVNGNDDATMTSARVRPFSLEKTTSGFSPSRPQPSRTTIRPCVLSRCSDLIDSIAGPSTVQCHCQYPEVYPCILCCGTYVDRELNPLTTAKSTRLQLPPAEKIYPRHKLDLSYHEKLSRSSDCCHSLNYDESFVSRRPRMVYFSQSHLQQSSPQVTASQHRQQQSNSDQHNSSSQTKHPTERPSVVKAPQVKCPESEERSSESQTKTAPKRVEQPCHSDFRNTSETEQRPDASVRGVPHTPYMRRKRGRRKQHPYSRPSVQHSSGNYYVHTNEDIEYGLTHEERGRVPANFCKQRPANQIHQQPRNRSVYRHQWHQNRSSDQHVSYRHRNHQQQYHQHPQHRSTNIQSRRAMQNRLHHHHSHQQQESSQGSCRLQLNHQKLSGNRHLTNSQLSHHNKARLNLDVPITESSTSLSSRSDTVPHSGVNMCNFLVDIASVNNAKDSRGTKEHSSLMNEHLSRRQPVCTTVPVMNRRPLGVKVGVLSRGSSIPDEDTASISSSGGSVKSMRSVCSSRLEMRRRSEDSTVGLRPISVTVGQSDHRHTTDIETPLWRRLPAGISAVHEDSAVMHLLSVGGVGTTGEREVPSNGGTDPINSGLKMVEKESTAYHMMMLDDSEKTNRIEDTSDRIYLQRHKMGELTERATNVPANNVMEDLYLQPGEFRDQVRR